MPVSILGGPTFQSLNVRPRRSRYGQNMYHEGDRNHHHVSRHAKDNLRLCGTKAGQQSFGWQVRPSLRTAHNFRELGGETSIISNCGLLMAIQRMLNVTFNARNRHDNFRACKTRAMDPHARSCHDIGRRGYHYSTSRRIPRFSACS